MSNPWEQPTEKNERHRTEQIPLPNAETQPTVENILQTEQTIHTGCLNLVNRTIQKLREKMHIPSQKDKNPDQENNEPEKINPIEQIDEILHSNDINQIVNFLNEILSNPNHKDRENLKNYLKKHKRFINTLLNRMIDSIKRQTSGSETVIVNFLNIVQTLGEENLINEHRLIEIIQQIQEIVRNLTLVQITPQIITTYLSSENTLFKIEGVRLYLSLNPRPRDPKLKGNVETTLDELFLNFRNLDLNSDNIAIRDRIQVFIVFFGEVTKSIGFGNIKENLGNHIESQFNNTDNKFNLALIIIKTPGLFNLLSPNAQRVLFLFIVEQIEQGRPVINFILIELLEDYPNNIAKSAFEKFVRDTLEVEERRELIKDLIYLRIDFDGIRLLRQTAVEEIKKSARLPGLKGLGSISDIKNVVTNAPAMIKRSFNEELQTAKMVIGERGRNASIELAELINDTIPLVLIPLDVHEEYKLLRGLNSSLHNQNVTVTNLLRSGDSIPIEIKEEFDDAVVRCTDAALASTYQFGIQQTPGFPEPNFLQISKDFKIDENMHSPKAFLKLVLSSKFVDPKLQQAVKNNLLELLKNPEKNLQVANYYVITILNDVEFRNLVRPPIDDSVLAQYGINFISSILTLIQTKPFNKLTKFERDTIGNAVNFLASSDLVGKLQTDKLKEFVVLIIELHLEETFSGAVLSIFKNIASNTHINAVAVSIANDFKALDLSNPKLEGKITTYLLIFKNLNKVTWILRPVINDLQNYINEQLVVKHQNLIGFAILLFRPEFYEFINSTVEEQIYALIIESTIKTNTSILPLITQLSENETMRKNFNIFLGKLNEPEHEETKKRLFEKLNFLIARQNIKRRGLPNEMNLIEVVGESIGINADYADIYYVDTIELIKLINQLKTANTLHIVPTNTISRILRANHPIPEELIADFEMGMRSLVNYVFNELDLDLTQNPTNLPKRQSNQSKQSKSLLIDILSSDYIDDTIKEAIKHKFEILVNDPQTEHQYKIILLNDTALLSLLGDTVENAVLTADIDNEINTNLRIVKEKQNKMNKRERSIVGNTLHYLEHSKLIEELVNRGRIDELKRIFDQLVELFKLDSIFHSKIQHVLLKLMRNPIIWVEIPDESKFGLFEYVYLTLANKNFTKEVIGERKRISSFFIEVVNKPPEYLREFTTEFFAITKSKGDDYNTDFRHITSWDSKSNAKMRGALRKIINNEIQPKIDSNTFNQLEVAEINEYYANKKKSEENKQPYNNFVKENPNLINIEIPDIPNSKLVIERRPTLITKNITEHTGFERNQIDLVELNFEKLIQEIINNFDTEDDQDLIYILRFLKYLEFFLTNNNFQIREQLFSGVINDSDARIERQTKIIQILLHLIKSKNINIANKAVNLLYYLYKLSQEHKDDIKNEINAVDEEVLNDEQKTKLIEELQK